MTEIPEHLKKRAAEARQKVAENKEPSTAPSKIPARLLERAKAARPTTASAPVLSVSDVVPDVDFVCDRPDDGPYRPIQIQDESRNGPLIAVGILLAAIIAFGGLLFLASGADDSGTGSDPVAAETTIPGTIILPGCESLSSYGYTGPKVSCIDSSGNISWAGQ